MQKKPHLILIFLLAVALVLLVIYLTQSNPFQEAQQPQKKTNPLSQQPPSSGTFEQIHENPAVNLYAKNCARCHGKVGEGMAENPSINYTNMDLDQIKEIIQEGRGNMPGFPKIEDPELTELARLVISF